MWSVIVPIIIICIIVLQIYFFVLNYKRMMEFKKIFSHKESWSIKKNVYTGFVSGISGNGNGVFASIVDSINKYLGNNSGSVIDFQLLKDAVDRHCDSVEEDINTQTPVPLYCGLAGTMAGVICGLVPLISSGALMYLLSGNIGDSTKERMDRMAAAGIEELLTGVAWAMLASICGIILTTVCSLLFKRHKLAEEKGKNTFLAWMQSSLLPELPSDTSDALNKLVKNLNNFNQTFAKNTNNLGSTLEQVNEAYRIQGDIIQAVKDMDVMKMAKANVKVLQELQGCTSQLEQFSDYLATVNQYTDTIRSFTEKFESESDRLHVLEEIRNFFTRHKGEIAKTTADSDYALKTALTSLKETSQKSITEFNKELVEQSETFKRILKEEQEAFEELAHSIKVQFGQELKQMPMLEQNLNKISTIPNALDKLISRIEMSNKALASNVAQTMRETAAAVATQNPGIIGGTVGKVGGLSAWAKYTIIGSLIVIALACVTNTVFSITQMYSEDESIMYSDSSEVITDTAFVQGDTVDSYSMGLSPYIGQ